MLKKKVSQKSLDIYKWLIKNTTKVVNVQVVALDCMSMNWGSPTGCLILGKITDLLVPQFLYLWNGENSVHTSEGCNGD
jgi:hypothetical protein